MTDEQWEFVEPLLPTEANAGRPRIDDRLVINGILLRVDNWMSMDGHAQEVW